MVSMNKLATENRIQVLAALVEGNSIRATVRMTGVTSDGSGSSRPRLGASRSHRAIRGA